MKPFLPLITYILVPFLAYASTVLLNRLILAGYNRAKEELEFPDSLSGQATRTRRLRLTAGLVITYILAIYVATSWPTLIIYLIYVAVLTAIVVMDFEQQIILNSFIAALVVLALAATPFLAEPLWLRALCGAGAFALFLLIALVTRGGIGGGDIKLVGALGLFLGQSGIIFTVVCGIIAGGIVSLFLLLTKRKNRKDAIAYGPYFAVAAMLALFL
jgi:prepilin signal peptidase PulO-like enzyme (type II secretory pathway)